MIANAQHYKRVVADFFRDGVGAGGADTVALAALVATNYQPHLAAFRSATLLHPGIDALRDRLRAAGPIAHRVVRLVADHDLVFAHVKYPGAAPLAGVDVFRFDDDGRIAEHWNVRQPLPPGGTQGEDRFTNSLEPPVAATHDPAWLKKRLSTMLAEFWAKGNASLVSEYYSTRYIQHNADMPGGYQRIKEIVETEIPKYVAVTGGPYPISVHAMAAEHDIVCVYLSIFMAGLNRHDGARSTNVDMFRVDAGGKMIEHWDVLEMDCETIANAATLF